MRTIKGLKADVSSVSPSSERLEEFWVSPITLERRLTLEKAAFNKHYGNRTKWSPIMFVIIRVMTKSDDRAAGVQFIYHKYDYILNWTTQSLFID